MSVFVESSWHVASIGDGVSCAVTDAVVFSSERQQTELFKNNEWVNTIRTADSGYKGTQMDLLVALPLACHSNFLVGAAARRCQTRFGQ